MATVHFAVDHRRARFVAILRVDFLEDAHVVTTMCATHLAFKAGGALVRVGV